jgi:hypothetical protein
MKNINLVRRKRLRSRIVLSLVLAVWGALVPLTTLRATDDKSDNAAKTEKPAKQGQEADSSNKTSKPAPPKLSGAELYSMHCNRCHPERYPTERTAAQWKTILLHMRVRANLPADQARTILKYLQDNSGR